MHSIRLHGPWKRVSDDADQARQELRFKVPGRVPIDEHDGQPKIVTIRRTWNRPPSGLSERSIFRIVVESYPLPIRVTCNGNSLPEIVTPISENGALHQETESGLPIQPGLQFHLSAEFVQRFNCLELEFQSVSNEALEVHEVTLVIDDQPAPG